MCLKESCFPDCWKALSVVLVFNLRMLGEGLHRNANLEKSIAGETQIQQGSQLL